MVSNKKSYFTVLHLLYGPSYFMVLHQSHVTQ